MSDPYIGEIRMFGGSFAPAGWALCNGQLLPISENDALFTLIGTTYGGDGQETFGLPNLNGRLPVHQGQGPGLSQSYQMGEMAGVESVTLSVNQMPAHPHGFLANNAGGGQAQPSGGVLGKTNLDLYSAQFTRVNMLAQALSPAGGSQPHDNMQPYLCVTYIISLFGIFPSQT